MSALPPKADIERRDWHVRFVPKPDSCTAANDLRVARFIRLSRRRLPRAERPRSVVVFMIAYGGQGLAPDGRGVGGGGTPRGRAPCSSCPANCLQTGPALRPRAAAMH